MKSAEAQPLEIKQTLPDEEATLRLGAQLAAGVEPCLKIYLTGDLGAGKTTLARGLLRALGVSGRIRSPTFALVESYNPSSLYLYHFDFYRFQDPREWQDAGFRDIFAGNAICIVEWPEKAETLLPPPDVRITLEHLGHSRIAYLVGLTERGKRCLATLNPFEPR
ncbi:MAG TPA: tRNA (adenosine(37)-N6)-threonylcarbamoyltransferase complex ATPase subunit type 1 TsaE [Burkholderiales bacterium]|nr:tRNA (adenosine(37)-N6)-threonylcarbamoyltransferase complex ATPase subunit type 1 TsaE [Burkholderiales bacterium]